MAIRSVGSIKISNMRSKTFRAPKADELDQVLNDWLKANSERDIVSFDMHGNEYFCWVVVLYLE
ncbi:MAG: hypothetical protein IPG59_13925 [Candidatus Melainabacteria bacterium]|nr:MAG: hypothetical protein IPG59_13925 [Candidatus Melainabacteria bacterium]